MAVPSSKLVEQIRLPVVVEQTIGELALDPSGHRTVPGAALAVIADYVNAQSNTKHGFTLPLRFYFPNGDGSRFVVTLDTE